MSKVALKLLQKSETDIANELSTISSNLLKISMADFVEKQSGAGNDIIQAIFGRLVAKFIPTKQDDINEIYNKVGGVDIKRRQKRKFHQYSHK